MIVRPIAHRDLDALHAIAIESGPGFTSLMPDRDALARKIQHSIDSFQRDVSQPRDEHYLFVLEDSASGRIAGTTAIEASVGHSRPLQHFHRNSLAHHCRDQGQRYPTETLTRCNHYSGCTEICSLFLRPEFRRASAGKLLSRVRFLFMALHPERFASTVIAEMRGVADASGQSPFWNWLKAHFVDMEFDAATRLAGSDYTHFIETLMPAHPLSSRLLSPEARAALSEVHDQTRPALRLLEAEGFQHRGYVDLLDGGPTVECGLGDIRSIRESQTWRVRIGSTSFQALSSERHDLVAPPLLITNTGTHGFRATVTSEAQARPDTNTLILPELLAQELGLRNGSSCGVLALAQHSQSTAADHPHVRQEVHYAH